MADQDVAENLIVDVPQFTVSPLEVVANHPENIRLNVLEPIFTTLFPALCKENDPVVML